MSRRRSVVAKFEIRAKARDDLRSIRRWIARDNPVRALSFVGGLNLHFQKLADLRLRHEVRSELGHDVRISVHGSYNIYYRFVGPGLEDVQIIRVVHAAMDLGNEDIE